MSTMASPVQLTDPESILDRHTSRRSNGIPTVSLLIGPIGAGGRTWRRWAADSGRCIVAATGSRFPYVEWVRSLAEQVNLPLEAVRHLARRADRDPEEFQRAWRVKTASDRDRFWSGVARQDDDDVLEALTALAVQELTSDRVASPLGKFAERTVPIGVRLAATATLPAVLFVAGSTSEFLTAAPEAAAWAERVPTVPIAVAVTAAVWFDYLANAPDSRAKALLREGEVTVPVIDAAKVKASLAEVGAGTASLLAQNGADSALIDSAMALVRATGSRPRSEAEDNRARSAAEQFLFEFLQSLPETAGRFELNAALDFRFGPRFAEVDLLCRKPPIALEIDGYFHFGRPEDYRRDRSKDWELQRRGYLVLRFLAEDLIPQLEVIRDRILDSLSQPGESP